MPIELEITWVAKADDLSACDPTGRPKINRDGSGVCGGPADRISERRQEKKLFFIQFFPATVTQPLVKAAVEVSKL